MVSNASSASRPKTANKPASPGRPKDLGKRAAILEAAKRLFSDQGFHGASMDQIAAEQFFSLIKGEMHGRMICGLCAKPQRGDVAAHIEATVDMFLRAYSVRVR